MTTIQENAAGFLLHEDRRPGVSFLVLNPSLPPGPSHERDLAFRAIPREAPFRAAIWLPPLLWFGVILLLPLLPPQAKEIPFGLFLLVSFLVGFGGARLVNRWASWRSSRRLRRLGENTRLLKSEGAQPLQELLLLLAGELLSLQPQANAPLTPQEAERLKVLREGLWKAAEEELAPTRRIALLQEMKRLIGPSVKPLLPRPLRGLEG